MTVVFLKLAVGHFLADYPLQGDFLAAAKNHRKPIPGVPWYQALIAHSAIQAATGQLLNASPLTLEAVRSLAVAAIAETDLGAIKRLLREQIDMLGNLIERAETEEEAIYEWASGQ